LGALWGGHRSSFTTEGTESTEKIGSEQELFCTLESRALQNLAFSPTL
jgi:hypothetical protein